MIPYDAAVREVADWLGVPVSAILSRRRDQQTCRRRKILYWTLIAGGWTPGMIGRYIFHDRSTILHALGLRPGHRRRGHEPD